MEGLVERMTVKIRRSNLDRDAKRRYLEATDGMRQIGKS